ncbi:MAG TPA: DNA-3-methyladenine glycosylase I [Gammaproteobacteria bacterium]|nr:DNA-3-methyladenine glycosylase I [Gammaproteobacteria bacterium]
MIAFQTIYEEALFREGSESALKSRLPVPLVPAELRKKDDAWYLSLMSRRIFRAGLKHSMVDAKWPVFEEAFHGFDIDRVRMMSDENLEALMADRRLIRHWGKLRAVRQNAQAMYDLRSERKSIGQYLAGWPTDHIVDLWHDLKNRFSQLGGNSGPYFLRMSGKDTFLLTDYVNQALLKWSAVQAIPRGKRALQNVQEIFNQWSDESQRPLCQVSMILALSVD